MSRDLGETECNFVTSFITVLQWDVEWVFVCVCQTYWKYRGRRWLIQHLRDQCRVYLSTRKYHAGRSWRGHWQLKIDKMELDSLCIYLDIPNNIDSSQLEHYKEGGFSSTIRTNYHISSSFQWFQLFFLLGVQKEHASMCCEIPVRKSTIRKVIYRRLEPFTVVSAHMKFLVFFL